MNDSNHQDETQKRRKILKGMTFGSGIAISLKKLPDTWQAPIVESVVLPAHAQTTGGNSDSASPFTCSIPFDLTFDGTPGDTPAIANIYTGFQRAGGPFSGNCTESGFQFAELPLVVTITSEGGDQFRVNYNLNSGAFTFEFVTTITEVNTGFMGSSAFDNTLNRDFNLSGFPAHEETKYTFEITAGEGNLVGNIQGNVWVNESVMFSDRDLKENFQPIDDVNILNKIAEIPIQYWNYSDDRQNMSRHIGPTAQDFYAAFELGDNQRRINTVDANGINMASIQALYRLLQDRDRKIDTLEKELQRVSSKLESVFKQNQ